MGARGYRKATPKPRRRAAEELPELGPRVQLRCKYHPRRLADLSTKRGNDPIVDVCWECWHRLNPSLVKAKAVDSRAKV